MSLARKILFALLGALAVAVVAALSYWSGVRTKTAMIVAFSLSGGFLVYFAILFAYCTKKGWRSDGPLRERLASDEPLFLVVREHKKGYHVCVFRAETTPNEEQLKALRAYEDEVPAPFLLIGKAVLTPSDLAAAVNKTVLLTKETRRALKDERGIGAFMKRNTFLTEDEKRK